jgi:hypothetical protein
MIKSILLFLCLLLCSNSALLAQSSGLRWNEPDSVILYDGPQDEHVLRFTVSNSGAKMETMDVRIEGDPAVWQLVATQRGYAEDIVMMPTETIWVDIKLIGPANTSTPQGKLIADGSKTDDTLRLYGFSTHNGIAWDPRAITFTLSEHSTDTVVKATAVNIWNGRLIVDDLVMEGDPAWQVNPRLPWNLSPSEKREINISYTPAQPGTHTARLIAKTSGNSDTLFLEGTSSRTVKGVYWDQDSTWMIPPSCSEATAREIELDNDGFSDALIDSVSVVGVDAQYFRIISTSPPGKVRDFVLAPAVPGNGVRYLIQFDPNGTTQSRVGDLIAHTSAGNVDVVKLIGLVPTSQVLDIDTTFTGLKVGVDHTFTLYVRNVGQAPFPVSSVYWTGELDATQEGIAGGTALAPGTTNVMPIVMRSEEAGTKTKTFKFNGGECDEPFEVRITAQFGEQSGVETASANGVEFIQREDQIIVKHSASFALVYRILDLSGRALRSGQVSQLGSIDITSLPTGALVLMLGDRSILKFFKQ